MGSSSVGSSGRPSGWSRASMSPHRRAPSCSRTTRSLGVRCRCCPYAAPGRSVTSLALPLQMRSAWPPARFEARLMLQGQIATGARPPQPPLRGGPANRLEG
jgi:hypothetical protein